MDKVSGKYRVLVNLPQMKVEELLAFKKALEEYYKQWKKDNKLKIIPVDDIVLEIGIGLIPLAIAKESNIVDRIQDIRREIGLEYGIQLPCVRLMDNAQLDKYEYCIKIKGEQFGKYKIKKNKFIAIENENIKTKITGTAIKEPVFGLPAILINKNQTELACEAGYTVSDAPGIILTHIKHIIETNLDKILSYQNSKDILSEVKIKNPDLVKDVLENMKFIDLKYILTKLVSKQISLVNIEKILELILKNIDNYKNNEDMIENILKEMKL
jgi:flagellar biosynthesis protein FlhA